MRDNRRKEMAAYIAKRQSATMSELCDVFHVSINTVRADVASLTKSGVAEKIYGGVRSTMHQEVPLFTQRTKLRPDAKFSIARAAAATIKDGDTMFIDAGTTTMHMLSLIPPEKHITIITGNLHIISQAIAKPNAEVIVLPGTVNRRTNSVADISTLEFLERYHFSKAFMATTGLAIDGALNVTSYLEYEIKRHAMQQSDERILLCDSGKYGSNALMSYSTLESIQTLITDDGCPEALKELCQRLGVDLVIAD